MNHSIKFESALLKSQNCALEPKRLVILLHGYGQSGKHMIRDFAGIFSENLDDTFFYAPTATGKCRDFPRGFDWLRYDDGEWSREAALNMLHKTCDELRQYIDELLVEHRLEERDVALLGYSQGGALALHTALQNGSKIAAVIAYATKIGDQEFLKENIASAIPVCLIHGKKDDVIDKTYYNEAVAFFYKYQALVVNKLFPDMGHKMHSDAVTEGVKFLMQVWRK